MPNLDTRTPSISRRAAHVVNGLAEAEPAGANDIAWRGALG
jgi:hypothetical protein